jgi:hypothetical protein
VAVWQLTVLMVRGLLLLGLFVAVAWDADGNPATDNLPHAVLTGDLASAQASDTVDDEARRDDPPRRPWPPRRWRHRWQATREANWRSIAISERGP